MLAVCAARSSLTRSTSNGLDERLDLRDRAVDIRRLVLDDMLLRIDTVASILGGSLSNGAYFGDAFNR